MAVVAASRYPLELGMDALFGLPPIGLGCERGGEWRNGVCRRESNDEPINVQNLGVDLKLRQCLCTVKHYTGKFEYIKASRS
jgi:hypothetical protein